MMRWEQLLNEKRIRLLDEPVDSHKSRGDLRSEFQRDYDRSLFSTPVRRLQDKAQVFPLEPHDSVRTRLTHSLEVSNVARGLATNLTPWLAENGRLADRDDRGLIEQRKASIELIAATCGLIHDLGNPPFGHSGEEAIREWFRAQPVTFFAEFDTFPTPGLRAQLKQDFLNFEGNAQTLRIVSRLQVLADFYGLNLTCGTMSAACKYIAPSSEADRDGKVHERKKPGFFTSEHDLIDRVHQETGTRSARNPITYLVEAADDIVYSTVTEALQVLASPRPLYLFGGLLRDLLVIGPTAVPRDVDLVIGDTTVDELADALAQFVDRRTRFGGLQLTVAGVTIDIWPLAETWAFRRPGSPPPSFPTLPRTTFLNVEAVALEVLASGEPGRLHAHGFFEAVQSETLEINFEDNPSPVLCVARSLDLATRLGFRIGPRLSRYLAEHLRVLSVEELARQQATEGGCVRCSEEVLRAWKAHFADPDNYRQPIAATPPRAKCA